MHLIAAANNREGKSSNRERLVGLNSSASSFFPLTTSKIDFYQASASTGLRVSFIEKPLKHGETVSLIHIARPSRNSSTFSEIILFLRRVTISYQPVLLTMKAINLTKAET